MKLREIQYSEDGVTPVDCPMCGMPSGNVAIACDSCFWAEGKMPPLVKAQPRQAERGSIARCGTPGCVSLHQVGPMDRHIGADGRTWMAKAEVTSSCGHHSAAEDCRCWGVWCIGTTITGWVGSDGARGAPDTWDRGNLQTVRQLAAQMAHIGATYELRRHDPEPKPLAPPPGIVATGVTACRCGRPVGPGWPCLSGGCAYDERGELLRPPVTFAGDLVGRITPTTHAPCPFGNCIADHANGAIDHVAGTMVRGVPFPRMPDAMADVIPGAPPAICPLRWCGREVREHTEVEVTRCAGYRGRLRVIEERLSRFKHRVALRDAEAGLMTPACLGSEIEWAKDRTAEEVETLRREWSALR